MEQLRIDFTTLQHHENTIDNQLHFEANRERFSDQCKRVYDALARGERLTTSTALIKYQIGDLRRRIKDLKDMWNVPVESVMISGNYKEYFIKISE